MRSGLILMMDRTFSHELNAIVVDKAIRYRTRGIIGIDIAGPPNPSFSYCAHADLVERAREAGLGITIHTGEEGRIEDMWEVLEHLRPDRVGHGILCAYDERLMEMVKRQGVTLEICPTSNLRTRAVRDVEELRTIIRTLREHETPFTLNTDGPEMLLTNLVKEYQFAVSAGLLSEEEARACMTTARRASFLNGERLM